MILSTYQSIVYIPHHSQCGGGEYGRVKVNEYVLFPEDIYNLSHRAVHRSPSFCTKVRKNYILCMSSATFLLDKQYTYGYPLSLLASQI